MHSVIRILLLCLGLVAAWPTPGQQQSAGKEVLKLAEDTENAKLAEAQGEVTIQLSGQPPRRIRAGQAIPLGAIVHTGDDSRALIVFSDGQVCALGEESTFRISSYHYESRGAGKSSVSVNLIDGSLRVVMGEIGRRNPAAVRLQAGVATFSPGPATPAGPADASFVVEGSAVAMTVQRGQLVATAPSGQSQAVTAGQAALLSPDGSLRRDSATAIMQQASQLSAEFGKSIAELQSFDQKIIQAQLAVLPPTSAGPTQATEPPPAFEPAFASGTPAPGSAGAGGSGCLVASCN